MIPHTARIKHDPAAGKWSDCFRTSVAAMLDIEDVYSVPHFFDNGVTGEAALAAFEAWLHRLNLHPIVIACVGTFEDVLMSMSAVNMPYLVIGENADAQHCVICLGDALLHDVGWFKSPMLRGIGPDGEWLVIFIGAKLNAEELIPAA